MKHVDWVTCSRMSFYYNASNKYGFDFIIKKIILFKIYKYGRANVDLFRMMNTNKHVYFNIAFSRRWKRFGFICIIHCETEFSWFRLTFLTWYCWLWHIYNLNKLKSYAFRDEYVHIWHIKYAYNVSSYIIYFVLLLYSSHSTFWRKRASNFSEVTSLDCYKYFI